MVQIWVELGRVKRVHLAASKSNPFWNRCVYNIHFPNFKVNGQTGNQTNTPKNPRKMSTRSLSQIPKSVRVNRKTDEINGKDKEFMTITVDDIANHFSEKYAPTKIKVV